jgi:thiol-disulfide isomerase/thioredoxin
MMDFSQLAASGLNYDAFLSKYGTAEQQRRWAQFAETVTLTAAQKSLLASFTREMHVFVLAGAWCGDCVNQCPIFHRIAQESSKIKLQFFDRDANPEFSQEMRVCGGDRVPAVLFLSEDYTPTGRYGDRTLAKYRDISQSLTGVMCPTGLFADTGTLHEKVIAEWLEQFERNQLILRTSSRLRTKHGD